MTTKASEWDVIIVDDEFDNAIIAQKMLEHHGVQRVRLADNAADGIQMMREQPPTFVLIDLGMPDIDGYAFRDEVLSDDELSSIPMIAFTAQGTPSDRSNLLASGFSGLVFKPFDMMGLIDEIEIALNK